MFPLERFPASEIVDTAMNGMVTEFRDGGSFDQPGLMAEFLLWAHVLDARESEKPSIDDPTLVMRMENALAEHSRGDSYPMAKRLRTLARVIKRKPGVDIGFQVRAIHTLADKVTALRH